MALGSWLLALGLIIDLILGLIRGLIFGSWVLGHGSWVLGLGSWVLGLGSWVLGLGLGSSFWFGVLVLGFGLVLSLLALLLAFGRAEKLKQNTTQGHDKD